MLLCLQWSHMQWKKTHAHQTNLCSVVSKTASAKREVWELLKVSSRGSKACYHPWKTVKLFLFKPRTCLSIFKWIVGERISICSSISSLLDSCPWENFPFKPQRSHMSQAPEHLESKLKVQSHTRGHRYTTSIPVSNFYSLQHWLPCKHWLL